MLHQRLFVMPHYVLVLFGGPSETLLAVVTPVRVVLSVDGYDVAFETRRVCCVVLTVLTLVDFAATVCFHVFLEFGLLPKAPLAPFALKGQVLSVYGEYVPAQSERVRDFKVTVPALMHLVSLVCLRVFLEF